MNSIQHSNIIMTFNTIVVFLLVAVGTITTNALSIVRPTPIYSSSSSRKPIHPIYNEISSSSTMLHVSMGSSVAPEHSDKEKKNSKNDQTSDDDDDDDWTPIQGGFIPNFLRKIRPKRNVQLVENLMDYKKVVVDEPEKLVVVRFFATWCRSCKASENHFLKLVSKFSRDVKFVEVPLTKETAYMLEGLDVKTVPFAHIYHPEAGLVEEMRASKRYSSELQKKVLSYVVGSCDLDTDDESNLNQNDTPATSSGSFE